MHKTILLSVVGLVVTVVEPRLVNEMTFAKSALAEAEMADSGAPTLSNASVLARVPSLLSSTNTIHPLLHVSPLLQVDESLLLQSTTRFPLLIASERALITAASISFAAVVSRLLAIRL